ncbi:MAG TPA: UdgX family uracil-DNA binding protein [Acetobacteraceae bacterium]|nr:UdgX family uracil-DNA binding protein [Acetobacteraceae bacterium]
MTVSIRLAHQVDWQGWRAAARGLALADIPPDQVVWSVDDAADPYAERPPPYAAPDASAAFTVPRALVALAETVIQAREPDRFALLYRLVWRAHRGDKHLLDQPADADVHRARQLAQSVRRDTHRLRATLRFRAIDTPAGPWHVAWLAPEHFILDANAPVFARRFAAWRWSILTPDRSAHWDGTILRLGPGVPRAGLADQDPPENGALDAALRACFAGLLDPAAPALPTLPDLLWRNLPAAAALSDATGAAPARAATDPEPAVTASQHPHPPANSPLAAARAEAATCRACPLWEHATQTVFGEGPEAARIMLVGEQPGDQEDLQGRPFVGPAGQVLDTALHEAGIDRTRVYVTNAVKHFKFEPRGKRRIHAKPDATEIAACRFWLEMEMAAVKPALTVLLGASAARSVLGRTVTISRERGTPIPMQGNTQALVTVHPSYLLRLPDEDAKRREYAAFVADLKRAVALVK